MSPMGLKPHKASNGPSQAVTISGLWFGSLYKSGREANNSSACCCAWCNNDNRLKWRKNKDGTNYNRYYIRYKKGACLIGVSLNGQCFCNRQGLEEKG